MLNSEALELKLTVQNTFKGMAVVCVQYECVCAPDLLLRHGAVVQVQSGDAAVCQLLNGGLLSCSLLQLWVHSLDKVPVL